MVKSDLEVSTFQKKPAYRYIRKSDNVPIPGDTTDLTDPMALIKLFDPTGSWSWYITDYDPDTRVAFGLVDGFEQELGSFSMEELVDLRGQFGLPLERDLHWQPRPISECYRR